MFRVIRRCNVASFVNRRFLWSSSVDSFSSSHGSPFQTHSTLLWQRSVPCQHHQWFRRFVVTATSRTLPPYAPLYGQRGQQQPVKPPIEEDEVLEDEKDDDECDEENDDYFNTQEAEQNAKGDKNNGESEEGEDDTDSMKELLTLIGISLITGGIAIELVHRDIHTALKLNWNRFKSIDWHDYVKWGMWEQIWEDMKEWHPIESNNKKVSLTMMGLKNSNTRSTTLSGLAMALVNLNESKVQFSQNEEFVPTILDIITSKVEDSENRRLATTCLTALLSYPYSLQFALSPRVVDVLDDLTAAKDIELKRMAYQGVAFVASISDGRQLLYQKNKKILQFMAKATSSTDMDIYASGVTAIEHLLSDVADLNKLNLDMETKEVVLNTCVQVAEMNLSSLPSKALAYYNLFLTLQPSNPLVLTRIGEIYQRLGDADKAYDFFHRVVSIMPQHPTAVLGVARYHLLKASEQPEVADKWLKESADNLAFALKHLNRIGLSTATKNFMLSPSFQLSPLYLTQVEILNKLGLINDAVSAAEEWRRQCPNDHNAHYHYLRQLANAHQSKEALEAGELALRLDPSQPEQYILLAKCAKDLKQYDSAMKYVEAGRRFSEEEYDRIQKAYEVELIRQQDDADENSNEESDAITHLKEKRHRLKIFISTFDDLYGKICAHLARVKHESLPSQLQRLNELYQARPSCELLYWISHLHGQNGDIEMKYKRYYEFVQCIRRKESGPSKYSLAEIHSLKATRANLQTQPASMSSSQQSSTPYFRELLSEIDSALKEATAES
eukprot:TRINITY_DN673_c0_g3_i1.p1 TRINITY_DN673_c0_g3~~TRINITY_DN673_c0_g3_i1.p1  ORF type:complete len:792 (-),score=140.47 TRINITY_DN673_c0_g3_i1:265-2616(-)